MTNNSTKFDEEPFSDGNIGELDLPLPKEKNKKNKAFYVALTICLLAVTAAGWSTYQSVKDFISVPSETSTKQKPSSNTRKERKNRKQNENKILDDTAKNENTRLIPYDKIEEPTLPPNSQNTVAVNTGEDKLIVYPSNKNLTKEFSGDKLVYSETLKDMRVHQGTDFAGEQGGTIRSVAAGIIKDIYKDQSYGPTIVIEHDTGKEKFTAFYSGLGENMLVKKGQQVNSGQEIGTLNKVPCEISESSHLHFAIMKDGKFIDPLLILEDEKESE